MKSIILLSLVWFTFSGYGQENRVTAPSHPELSNFSFLLGDFKFNGKTLRSKTDYNHYSGIWKSSFILDNTVIEEDFKIIGEDGSATFHGLTLRSFNSKTKEWVMGFFDALNPKWYPLGQPEFKDGTISFQGNLPGLQPGQLLQVTFYDIDENSFKWKSDISPDNGKTWIYDFTVIEASRL